MMIRRTVRAPSFLNRDRPRRTLAHGLFHLRPHVFRWRFDQDLQHAVVVDLEYLRRRLDTEAVEVALTHVHNDLHEVSPYHGVQAATRMTSNTVVLYLPVYRPGLVGRIGVLPGGGWMAEPVPGPQTSTPSASPPRPLGTNRPDEREKGVPPAAPVDWQD